jgi:hypothetical protein
VTVHDMQVGDTMEWCIPQLTLWMKGFADCLGTPYGTSEERRKGFACSECDGSFVFWVAVLSTGCCCGVCLNREG